MKTEEPFEFFGVLDGVGVKVFLGKQPANTVTYVERRGQSQITPNPISTGLARRGRGFSPEFSGDRTVTSPGSYTAKSDHGKVVTALHAHLLARGFTNLDNRTGNWDLHASSGAGIPCLFEVKTGASTTDVQTAIGQLLLYELRAGSSSKIVVLPHARGGERWRAVLAILGFALWLFAFSDIRAVSFVEGPEVG